MLDKYMIVHQTFIIFQFMQRSLDPNMTIKNQFTTEKPQTMLLKKKV